MKLHIHGKNVTITEAMLQTTQKKLSFLEKYFLIEEDTPANVSVKVYPNSLKVEVTILSKIAILRAEVSHEDYYAAIDLAIDKLEDQIRRQKTRLSRKHREKLSKAFIEQIDKTEEVKPIGVVKTKTISAEVMSLDDAIMRMEMLGHSFFIYTDEEEHQMAVVYKRLDGGYGLLETSPAK
ncbi:MAG TPA: ribosome-associated translation inhibitor RaiA [Erysipelotrichaceae bacterium]|nr:ribosome-associated translation inhibitor RaiA [Erysipelotrichaceae bacterium]